MREKTTEIEQTITCDGNTGICPNTVVGSQEYYEDTYFSSASVTFGDDDKLGTPMGNGIYKHDYKVTKVGPIDIKIHGKATATKEVLWPNNHCNEKEIVCQNIKSSFSKDDDTFLKVYGVDITIPPKLLVLVDEQGYTMGDTPIKYTIEPSGYQAGSAYVEILIKDKDGTTRPYWYIPGKTQGTDTVTLARGFWFDPKFSYEAKVILNKGSGVEIASKPIPLEFAHIYIEKVDQQYPDVKLRWNDYYPALGDKTIVIRGEDITGNPLTSKKIKPELIYPDKDHPKQKDVAIQYDPPEGVPFKDGKVALQLSAPTVAPPIEGDPTTGIDYVGIRFIVLSDDGKEEGELSGVWNIKNNSNTKLKEVLAVEAVFVYDESDAANHIGKTPATVKDDGERKFDFVQELLNQVVPRKRSVTAYTLLEENGIFGGGTEGAIAAFKQHFKVDNNIINGEKNTFNKLKKDYGFAAKDRIIDKETLVGVAQRDTDVRINESTTGDTGLYELYQNVVKKFVKEMIDEEKRYAGILEEQGVALPTLNWYARTGQGPAAHGPGMSYCYGGKQDIDAYNSSVTSCRSPSISILNSFTIYMRGDNNSIDSFTASLVDPSRPGDAAVNNTYTGNMNDTGCTYTGTQNFAGLYAAEYNSLNYGDGAHYRNNDNGVLSNPWPANAFPQFSMNPANPYWSGIDCSGLVQRAVETGRNIVPGFNITIPSPPAWRTAQQLFTENNYRNVYYFVNPTDPEESLRVRKKLKKGDCVRYGNTHISLVYSERWGVSRYSGDYDIIHACGYPYVDIDNNSLTPMVFSRKVLITPNRMLTSDGQFPSPTGFGRIKLWQ